VLFSDNSACAVTYEWDLGNGNFSTLQTPIATYPNPGVYDVKLIVFDGVTHDTILKPNYIEVFSIPEANFAATTDTAGCAPLSVSFEDLTVTDPIHGAGIETWSWSFGDGIGTSSDQDPDYTYNNLGVYSVSLNAIDSNGCSSYSEILNYITVTAPVASFTVDSSSTCYAPLNVTFTNTSTGDATPLTAEWFFGDGASSTDFNPVHSYDNPGVYTAMLVVTDALGCKDTMTMGMAVANVVANFEADPYDSIVCPNVYTGYLNTSIGASTYAWDFGDGSPIDTAANPSHTFSLPGEYQVSLYAYSDQGCGDTIIRTIYVEEVIADFTPDPVWSCLIPLEVTFTNNTTNGSTYQWDFGDENNSTDENPTNTYLESGTFTNNSSGDQPITYLWDFGQ